MSKSAKKAPSAKAAAKPSHKPAPKAAKPVAKPVAKAPSKPAASTPKAHVAANPAVAHKPTGKTPSPFLKKTPAPSVKGETPAPVIEPGPEVKALMLNARKRKSTPAIFKIRSRKNTPIVFTLDDVRDIIKNRKNEKDKPKGKGDSHHPLPRPSFRAIQSKPAAPIHDKPKHAIKSQKHGAASLADILGVASPPKTQKAVSIVQIMDDEKIPQKWRKFYRQLVTMREEIRSGLDMHTQETLKRSAKEDSGDLSGYSQHMADAGTDTFDRDFALSLVSSEQELLYEIEEALKRIRGGTYGTCEITGQTISAERLSAVPFTRYSLDGQKELEKQRRFGTQRNTALAAFVDAAGGDDAPAVTDEDAEG